MTAHLLGKLETWYPFIYGTWPFVTESVTSAEDLTNLGIASNRVTRIPPGVDYQRFTPGAKAAKLTIVYFGGMRRYKRPLDAVYACNELKNRGWRPHLYMIGCGPLLNEIRRVVRALQLEDSIIVTGRLAEEDLIAILQSSHINLHCAVTEGWCMSAMEAAACGVPTVAYRVPGILDSVVHGRTGWLVDDASPSALSTAIEQILQSGQDWTGRCRDYAMGFSWDRCVERWNAHLQSLTSAEKTHQREGVATSGGR